jgi:putative sterol carrier protein
MSTRSGSRFSVRGLMTREIHCSPVGALFLLPGLLGAVAAVAAEPPLMSGDWGVAACAAWNADPVLTGDLVESGWIENDKGRGYKIMQVYREDCDEKPTVELRVSLEDGRAQCVYGGPVQAEPLDGGADYVMHATTKHWREMGAGEYGPMKGMMFGRLSFSGPYGEAMGNMGPFTNFLLLVGKVPGGDGCP